MPKDTGCNCKKPLTIEEKHALLEAKVKALEKDLSRKIAWLQEHASIMDDHVNTSKS